MLDTIHEPNLTADATLAGTSSSGLLVTTLETGPRVLSGGRLAKPIFQFSPEGGALNLSFHPGSRAENPTPVGSPPVSDRTLPSFAIRLECSEFGYTAAAVDIFKSDRHGILEIPNGSPGRVAFDDQELLIVSSAVHDAGQRKELRSFFFLNRGATAHQIWNRLFDRYTLKTAEHPGMSILLIKRDDSIVGRPSGSFDWLAYDTGSETLVRTAMHLLVSPYRNGQSAKTSTGGAL